MSIGYKKQTAASVPLPPAGENSTFFDIADDKFKRKESDGSIVSIEDVAAGVASFDGRTGIVLPQAGDYTASEITNVPIGPVTANTVQAAINEIAGFLSISPAELYGLVTNSDNTSQALSKLQYTQVLQKVDVDQNVSIPTGFTWIRERTRLLGTNKITLNGTARLRLI